MVDKIEFNPFTGDVFTAEQIKELDTDGDGEVSASEVRAKWTWLSENSQDTDSAVNIVSSGTGASGYAGVKDTASSPAELQTYMNTVVDEFLEKYFSDNPELTAAEREYIQNLVSTFANEIISKQLGVQDRSTFDMNEIVNEFITGITKQIEDSNKAMGNFQSVLSGYEDNTEENLESMMLLSMEALENDYISDSEWNTIKNKAIQYLLGALLSGNIDTDLLTNLKANYAKDSNYKVAIDAINKLKDCCDPIESMELLTKAQNALTKFLESCGKDKTVGCIKDYSDAKMESKFVESLNKIADKYKEQFLLPDTPEDAKELIEKIIQNAIPKFLSQVQEKGTIAEYTEATLESQFMDFITNEIAAYVNSQIELVQFASAITEANDALISISDKANENGNISTEEKAAIVDAATTVIMKQLISGMDDIPLLESLNPNYKNSSQYAKIKNLITQVKGEVDSDKIQQYLDEVEKLIKEILDTFDGKKLVDAVNSTKPMEVSDKSKSEIIYNSSISSDYQANASRSTSRGKQNEDRLTEIQDMAKQDMLAVAETLKAKLKSEMGDNYNEALAQKYIDDAMNATIAMFTANVSRRNGHGDYSTKNDEQAFVFLRRSGTHKGRYVYNVQALINTFIDNFNKTSKNKNAARNDTSLATYDFNNVMASSLGNDYWRNKSVTLKGENDDETVYAQLIEQAKEDLRKVGESLKASLRAEGVTISDSIIDEIIEECINETIADMKAAFQYCQPSGKVSGGGISIAVGVSSGIGVVAEAGVSAYLATAAAAAIKRCGTAAAAKLASAKTAMSLSLGTAGLVAGAVAVGIFALKNFTNVFGATYGKHNQDAGFYFERKSHSHSGKWGYDTQTLVNVFMSKINAKLAEQKEKDKEKDESVSGLKS